jgi:hypothetical protein
MMKTLLVWMTASIAWLAAGEIVTAQTNAVPLSGGSTQAPALKKALSDKSFLGTPSVLTLGGDYVNNPKEDYETIGIWTNPLTLDQMHGMIAEVGFGEATKKGEWQLRYKQKLMTMDSSWQAISDSPRYRGLSDRRSQVLKASYNLRDWWQVGVAAMVENKISSDNGVLDFIPFGLRNGESLGFQLDTSLGF